MPCTPMTIGASACPTEGVLRRRAPGHQPRGDDRQPREAHAQGAVHAVEQDHRRARHDPPHHAEHGQRRRRQQRPAQHPPFERRHLVGRRRLGRGRGLGCAAVPSARWRRRDRRPAPGRDSASRRPQGYTWVVGGRRRSHCAVPRRWAGSPVSVRRPRPSESRRSSRCMSWTARSVPPSVPVTLDRPLPHPGHGTGRLTDPPALGPGPQHHLQRPARASIDEAQLEQGRPAGRTRMGPRSFRAHGTRRPTSRASHRFAKRACSGQAARSGARRAPIARSAAPSSTRPTSATRSRGSSEPSQSMKATSGAAAAARPAKQAAPEPAPRLADDGGAEAGGRPRRSRPSSRCRR